MEDWAEFVAEFGLDSGMDHYKNGDAFSEASPQPVSRQEEEAFDDNDHVCGPRYGKAPLAFLLGRFSGRVLRSGEHLVPEAALEALADQNISFTVKGKTTYEQ